MAILQGSQDSDQLTGTPESDKIYGFEGDDVLTGERGNDSIYGGAGNNTLYGGDGSDFLWVGEEAGNNRLFGGDGNDFLTGGSGDDYLSGGAGDDRLQAGDGDDLLFSGTGIDIMYGAQGNDSFNATFADRTDPRRLGLIINEATINSTATDSITAYGEQGDDLIYGTNGNDVLDGGDGDDWLFGADGNDKLISSSGSDVLNGGDGDDLYVVKNAAVLLKDSGGDDSIEVRADWLKVPSSIETRAYGAGIKPLPYWLDASLSDSAAGISQLMTEGNRYYYSFPSQAPEYVTSSESLEYDESKPTEWQALTALQQILTERALAVVSSVTGLTFSPTQNLDRLNTLSFAATAQITALSAFTSPSFAYSGSDILINSVTLDGNNSQDFRDIETASNSFAAPLWLRSIGGALGLKSPTMGTSISAEKPVSGPFLSLEVDIEGGFMRQLALYSPLAGKQEPLILSRMIDGTSNDEVQEHSLALGLLDIAALQFLYGPNTNARQGDDLYLLSADRANFIWDGGGFDTLDASAILSPVTLHLSPGGWGFVGDTANPSILAAGQQTINFGSRIEKVIGTAFADTLVGDELANHLEGGKGDDLLEGGSGIDTALIAAARGQVSMFYGGVVEGEPRWQARHGFERDTLISVERIHFTDSGLALDLTENAGDVAKLLGVLLGADALQDGSLVAIALNYADSGMDLFTLLETGLTFLLGDSPTSQSVVNLLHEALTGATASPEVLSTYGGMLDRGELLPAQLAVLAAETDLNRENIQLIGLVESGLPYALGS